MTVAEPGPLVLWVRVVAGDSVRTPPLDGAALLPVRRWPPPALDVSTPPLQSPSWPQLPGAAPLDAPLADNGRHCCCCC